jgi:hypothetical protein
MDKFKDTGISIIEDIRDNPEYAFDNHDKEIFIVYMSPLEYLDMCEKGFSKYSKINKEYSFTPTQSSLDFHEKEFSNPEVKINMPYIEETDRNNGFNENEYYFSQEGRHRAFTAHNLGIDKIPVTYVRTKDLTSTIGMEKYVKQPKVKNIEKKIKTIKKKTNNILKKNNIPLFEYNLGIKKYNNGQLAGFDINSFLYEEEVNIYLSYYIDEIMITHDTVNIEDDIVLDNILHEYGHLIFNILEQSEMNDSIKNFYSKKYLNDLDFKEKYHKFIQGEEYILDELTDEDIEYYDEKYWDYFLEEEFAENFMKYIRLQNNDLEYFKTVMPLSNFNLSNSEIEFFKGVIKGNKDTFNEFKSEQTDLKESYITSKNTIR